ncbi:MAG: NUDIX hydrolase, partial [Methanoregulaceae archaeon]|nr:NUDIX hydrolase [Methanoregulaceae archaeon]
TREVAEHGDAVVVIAVDPDGNLLLERQYRQAAGRELLEIPAGGIEPGEEPAATVCREMQEETGFMPRKVEKLGGFYSAPGWATEYLHLFLATDLVPSRLTAEDTHEITVEAVPVSRIAGLIMDGAIEDGKTVAGLLWYLKMREGR